jgi:hypothetical protein
LTEIPRVQADIITAIADGAGDVRCHSAHGFGSLDDAIDETHAAVLVTGESAFELSERYLGLLYRHPRLRVLAIRPDGVAALHMLRPSSGVIDDISSDAVLATIRAVGRTA